MAWSRWPTPTARGAVSLAAAVGCAVSAFWWGVPVLLSVTGLLVTVVVLAHVAVAVSHPRWEVRRSVVPHVAEPGEPVDIRFSLMSTRRSALDVAEWWEDASGGGHSGSFVARGAGTSAPHGHYEVRLSQRGPHLLGPTSVRVTDPFALATRWTQLEGENTVIVLPHRYPLDGRVEALTGAQDREDSALRLRPSGTGDADVLARPYRTGDAVKRLHWKATAHRGTLMVRHDQQQSQRQVHVVVDLRGDSARDLDWRVSAAASVLQHLHHDDIDLHLSAGWYEQPVGRDDALRPALVDLALAEPQPHGPSLDPHAPMIVVAGRIDASVAGEWLTTRRRPAYAMLHDASDAEALTLLREDAWRVVTYRDRDDVGRAWNRLGEGPGR
ncbi:DUF58 domain-containing protein [Aeromicrobium piscarium]|uniref:DUF58 domain-containing protein n=1 Tax=Aeromicrobium piscarium TaxID=2590901 RepID=A0A554S7T1_9ACTN|nr:DUF58 domain-containing protein [Aeromicrobium piscarium]TSD62402.1 DUF58 domain-containing protein [Aeromicrobium piscarium]